MRGLHSVAVDSHREKLLDVIVAPQAWRSCPRTRCFGLIKSYTTTSQRNVEPGHAARRAWPRSDRRTAPNNAVQARKGTARTPWKPARTGARFASLDDLQVRRPRFCLAAGFRGVALAQV